MANEKAHESNAIKAKKKRYATIHEMRNAN